jgi:hypothetical protein
MGINFEQDERTPEERKKGVPHQTKSRRLPISELAKVADAVRFADGVERTVEAAEGEEIPSVTHSARDGFVNGFGGAIGRARPVAEAAAAHSTGALQGVSSIDLAIDVAESAESGLSQDALEKRMQRFPELRDVTLPTGAAAQFPELAEQPRAATVPEAEEEGALAR